MRWLWAKLEPGITRGAAWSVMVLFIAMIVLTGASYILTSRAILRAEANAASIEQLCTSSNEFRAEQVQLWEFVIRLSAPPPHETPAAKKARVAALKTFTVYLHHVFAPRNCTPGAIHATG